MAKMFRKRSKTDSQMEYTCSVRFLDDEPMQFTFKKDTIGQWLFDRVCEEKKLMEKDYFGLRYVDSEKQRHWLDPLKTVYKQMKGVSPMVLCFRVKFYPEDPSKLHEEITRYYLFLQLRRDLHHGRLLCSPDDAVSLAAYIVQSEVGDYDLEDHPPGYISEFKMLPKQTPKLEDRVMELHKSLHGQVPSEAESNFLKKACTLDTYGVDPHQVKDQRGDQLYLGITHQGIMTFRGSRRTQLYKWSQIRRIAYEGKMFIIHININEDENATNAKKVALGQPLNCSGPNVVQLSGFHCISFSGDTCFMKLTDIDDPNGCYRRHSCWLYILEDIKAIGSNLYIGRQEAVDSRTGKFLAKQQPVGYKCLTPAAAKYLWRCAVEQQLFFTLSTSNTAPKMRSGGTLFTRGSKFRFSGRCQTEAYEASEHIRRSEPNFQRSSSLPNFARRNPESRNSTISHRDSALSDSIQEESAVDVPRVTADRRRPASEVEPSPVVKAPLAAQENFDEFQKQQQQQQQQQQQDARQIPEIVTPLVTVTLASPTTATPPRMNGQVVTESMETPSPGDHDISLDTTMTYQPDSTFYDEEEDSGTKPSLEEEIQQLDEHFNMIEQNHISAQGGSETPSVSTTSPPPPESVPVTEAGKKHEGSSICKAIVVSLFVALLLFSVLFYILFFSGLDHPVLTEMRNHLQFLDPVQDYVSKVVKKIPQYFSN